jgi:hypothetical protein
MIANVPYAVHHLLKREYIAEGITKTRTALATTLATSLT